jgi:hypothetical protein
VENGKSLLKESAVTNLVEHPIQLRPPSKSLFGLFTLFETFLVHVFRCQLYTIQFHVETLQNSGSEKMQTIAVTFHLA